MCKSHKAHSIYPLQKYLLKYIEICEIRNINYTLLSTSHWLRKIIYSESHRRNKIVARKDQLFNLNCSHRKQQSIKAH
jgi:hypothetical protein